MVLPNLRHRDVKNALLLFLETNNCQTVCFWILSIAPLFFSIRYTINTCPKFVWQMALFTKLTVLQSNFKKSKPITIRTTQSVLKPFATFQNFPDLVRTFQSFWQSFQTFHTFAEASRTGQNVTEALATFQNFQIFYEASRTSQIVPEVFAMLQNLLNLWRSFWSLPECFKAFGKVSKYLRSLMKLLELARSFQSYLHCSKTFPTFEEALQGC